MEAVSKKACKTLQTNVVVRYRQREAPSTYRAHYLRLPSPVPPYGCSCVSLPSCSKDLPTPWAPQPQGLALQQGFGAIQKGKLAAAKSFLAASSPCLCWGEWDFQKGQTLNLEEVQLPEWENSHWGWWEHRTELNDYKNWIPTGCLQGATRCCWAILLGVKKKIHICALLQYFVCIWKDQSSILWLSCVF